MSTSSSPARNPARNGTIPFHYADVPDRALGSQGGCASPAPDNANPEYDPAQREESAREAGRKEAEARIRAGFDAELERTRAGVQLALEGFAKERAAYFRQVEAEVVQLALSIARKILHREARVDPVLLGGMVRVALDQIEVNTLVRVRVPPVQAADCRAFFVQHMDQEHMPEIVADAGVEVDHCILETGLGSTELGIEVQLKEIEDGLADLMAQRPDRVAT